MKDAVEPAKAPAFISYATADRKQALALCTALEKRGIASWISCRDVAPGENYQESIVRALRAAPAVVLIFSAAANSSEEIKKELSLASRYLRPVIAVRLANVEPTDAFAYELSTRQWIDAFTGLDRAADTLAQRLHEFPQVSDAEVTRAARAAPRSARQILIPAVVAFVVIAAATGLWFTLRQPAAEHSMAVRLDAFRELSSRPSVRHARHDPRRNHCRIRRRRGHPRVERIGCRER